MATFKRKAFGFYRPHKPVNFDNLAQDLKTGELKPMPSLTRQEYRDQCDINNILKQFKKTGIISHISAQQSQGAYEELPDPMEYQDALNAVLAAQESFATLPSKVRTRFDNDPEKFLSFMHDPKNVEEMYELGLATRPSKPAEPSSSGAVGAASGQAKPAAQTTSAQKPSSDGSNDG